MVPLNLICLSTCITKLFVFGEILLDLSFSNSRTSKISHQFWPTFGDTDMSPKYKRLTCRGWHSSKTSTNNWTVLKSFCQRNYSLIRIICNPGFIKSLCWGRNAWACQNQRVLNEKRIQLFNFTWPMQNFILSKSTFHWFQWISMNFHEWFLIQNHKNWSKMVTGHRLTFNSPNMLQSNVHQKLSKYS